MADQFELQYHFEASAELETAAVWYEEKRKGLGLRFYASVQRIEELITQFPETGTLVKGAGFPEGVRRFRIPGFPYLLVYVLEPRLTIVAIAHSKRRPGYWKDRI